LYFLYSYFYYLFDKKYDKDMDLAMFEAHI